MCALDVQAARTKEEGSYVRVSISFQKAPGRARFKRFNATRRDAFRERHESEVIERQKPNQQAHLHHQNSQT
jgi:hypothetical protein